METNGKVVVDYFKSNCLKNNPLGDPSERRLHVYLPPCYEYFPQKHYPTLLVLCGFTGTGATLFNESPLSSNLAQRLDQLILGGKCEPVVVVAPDCFTRVGGSQHLNSTAIGNYEDYLTQEIVPYVRQKYRTQHWGVYGKSSGGYGAMVLGMRHPELFQVLGSHSGDSNFELCYLADFPKALDGFKKAGGPKAWLEKFWKDENKNRREYHSVLNALGMSAAYSPNPESPHMGIDFPFDLETGAFKPAVWKRWQAWDPVRMVSRYAENLKKLKFIYVDCGTRDEFGLHWGARAFVKQLQQHGIRAHHEEFEDGHMSISYRELVSLPLLTKALSY